MFAFVYDVLTPEVVVQLLMETHSLNYGDVSVIEGYKKNIILSSKTGAHAHFS